jgi:hypothetical protein
MCLYEPRRSKPKGWHESLVSFASGSWHLLATNTFPGAVDVRSALARFTEDLLL